MNKFYAGIGSRQTPFDVMYKMTCIAGRLHELGFILRTGGATGADAAFIRATVPMELYLPWDGFNGHYVRSYYGEQKAYAGLIPNMEDDAYTLARSFHPKFDSLTKPAQILIARNAYQIFGWHVGNQITHSSWFVLCWTEGGRGGGGTGQAIRIANYCNIPVFDLGSSHLQDLGVEEIYDLLCDVKPPRVGGRDE